ncbi:PREDICTED: ankyrin repeat domain-containing protein 54-like, partial [Priapulus caudatus]|uniref:Ankyrin repeat domain-containing protein 54-like n=1 Tax=Priapulus caudatus TaxID=37621 RepID=A0ABM1EJ85_PRICU
MMVRERKEAVVQMLLSYGADANAADSHGQTSLYHAACSGQLDIVRLLLEAGADSNVADTESGETPLMMAVREADEAVVRMLLSHGADPNTADSYGHTSLHMAALSLQFCKPAFIARLLMKYEASLYISDNVAETEE